MSENKGANIVEMLRQKTEELDMQHYLKSVMNGYTKKSVHEYLCILRRQQQSLSDTYVRDQQILLEEKEKLKKDNEELKIRLSQVESECRAHAETEGTMPEKTGELEAEIAALSGELSALRDAQRTLRLENDRQKSLLEESSETSDELTKKLEEAYREKQTLTEQLEEKDSQLQQEKHQWDERLEERKHESEGLKQRLEQAERENRELLEKHEETLASLLAEKNLLEEQLEYRKRALQEQSGRLEQAESEKQSLAEKLEEETDAYRKENQQLSSRIELKEATIGDYSKKLEEAGREKLELLEILKEERKIHGNEKMKLELCVEQLDGSMKSAMFKLEQSERERNSLKEKYKAEMLETRKLQEISSRLSSTLKQQNYELEQLRSRASDGKLTELHDKVNDLSMQVSTQFKALSNYNNENSMKAQIIRTLSQEKETLKQNEYHLMKQIEDANVQNRRLMLVNQTLSEQLENEYKKYIALIRDSAAKLPDEFTAGRTFSDAFSDIMTLELHNNQKNSETITKFYNDMGPYGDQQPGLTKEDITKCAEKSSHIIARSVSCKYSK